MLGEKLIAANVITREQLDDALKEQESSGQKIGEILVARGYASQDQVDAALQ